MSTTRETAKVLEQEIVAKCKWLQLEKVTYKDEEGQNRVWERVIRTTKAKTSKVDAVAVITRIKSNDRKDRLLFIRQFRPALGKYTIEFPAGLVDEGEDEATAALRELKEETGYVGTIVEPACLPPAVPISLDAGISNSVIFQVFVEVDADSQENLNVTRNLQEGEFIQSFLVEFEKVADTLQEWSQQGYVIDSRVWAFATGLQFSKYLKDT